MIPSPLSVATGVVCAVLLLACGGSSGDSTEQSVREAAPATVRTTPLGDVIGFHDSNGSDAWLGIPFARPPVAERRWRAPEPPEAEPREAEPREALGFADPCPQFASPLGGASVEPDSVIGSEDCLYLNVWAPRFAREDVPRGDERLPVMVWIHGGDNTIGHGGYYNGSVLAGSQRLVVLTLNYRLGALGWFSHPALHATSESEDERSGNFGTLDLVEALRWVRDNIGAFGGDAANVTVFGESAGGSNVLTLLLSPRAEGLFQRAIVQSGSGETTPLSEARNFVDDPEPGDEASALEISLRLLQTDGRAASRDAAKRELAAMGDADVARYLRGKTAHEILEAYGQGFAGMYGPPLLIRDGRVIPRGEPLELFAAGAYRKVPTILGTNRDETKLFMFASSDAVRRIFGIPLWLRDEARYNLLASYHSKLWKAAGADEIATSMRRAGGPGAWVYRWDWDEEPRVLLADLSVMLGAAHGLEIPFVFGHFELGQAGSVLFNERNLTGRKALSDSMMSYWAQLAHAGDPGRGRDGRQPEWTAWDVGGGTYLILDTPAGGGIRMANDRVTRDSVIAEVDTDPRLVGQREKCEVFLDLSRFSGRITEEEYPMLGARGCADYPANAYPWPE